MHLPPSPSLFKVLPSFQAGIVCGRWKCLYLTQIIGMSFLTASILETIPWPRNGNKLLAETSDKGRTISHCMRVSMHLCVCVCGCIRSCRPTCKCQYACNCRWWSSADRIRLIPLLGLWLDWVHRHGNSALSVFVLTTEGQEKKNKKRKDRQGKRG